MSVPQVEMVLQESLQKLKAWRDEQRPRPHLDDKIVAGWNGLMVRCPYESRKTVLQTVTSGVSVRNGIVGPSFKVPRDSVSIPWNR